MVPVVVEFKINRLRATSPVGQGEAVPVDNEAGNNWLVTFLGNRFVVEGRARALDMLVSGLSAAI